MLDIFLSFLKPIPTIIAEMVNMATKNTKELIVNQLFSVAAPLPIVIIERLNNPCKIVAIVIPKSKKIHLFLCSKIE